LWLTIFFKKKPASPDFLRPLLCRT
jgi:hypothetical protein